jgi:hypothetical protein
MHEETQRSMVEELLPREIPLNFRFAHSMALTLSTIPISQLSNYF